MERELIMGNEESKPKSVRRSAVTLLCVCGLLVAVWLSTSFACALQRHNENLFDDIYYALLDDSAPFAVTDGLLSVVGSGDEVYAVGPDGGKTRVGLAYTSDPLRFLVPAWSPFKNRALAGNETMPHKYVIGSPYPASPCDHYATIVYGRGQGVRFSCAGLADVVLDEVSVCSYLGYFEDCDEAVVFKTKLEIDGEKSVCVFRHPVGLPVLEWSFSAAGAPSEVGEEAVLRAHREALSVFLREYAYQANLGGYIVESCLEQVSLIRAVGYIG